MLQRWLGTWAPYIQELKINFTGHKNRITKSCLLSNTKKPNWEKDAGPRAACDWIILGERGSRRARNASWKEVEYEHFLYSLSNFFQCILCVVPGNGYMVEKREKSANLSTSWTRGGANPRVVRQPPCGITYARRGHQLHWKALHCTF